jgi:hypothetical protein
MKQPACAQIHVSVQQGALKWKHNAGLSKYFVGERRPGKLDW